MSKRRITQETFDAAVRENMEEFEMDPDEALREAVEQFESQGKITKEIHTKLKRQSHNNMWLFKILLVLVLHSIQSM